jgi:hypothetical protein
LQGVGEVLIYISKESYDPLLSHMVQVVAYQTGLMPRIFIGGVAIRAQQPQQFSMRDTLLANNHHN